MEDIHTENINALLNALQLSIDSPVDSITDADEDFPRFYLNVEPRKNDERFKYFTTLIKGEWKNQSTYAIHDSPLAFSQEFISFLLVTRLKKENMRSLAETDKAYQTFVEKLKLTTTSTKNLVITTDDQARTLIFTIIKNKKITLRHLAQKTGITQTALSNYKAGSDIRLSNMLKIAEAIGLKITLHTDTKS